MEYFAAGDLSNCKASIRDEADVRIISLQIATGLCKMHRMNIIHRDLKPHVSNSNVPVEAYVLTIEIGRTSSWLSNVHIGRSRLATSGFPNASVIPSLRHSPHEEL